MITDEGEFTSAPIGQMDVTPGLPADTVRLTGTVTLLFDAVVDATRIFALYVAGARPVGSAETVTVLGRPTSAMLPVGEALSQLPPETVMLAESAPPMLITLIASGGGICPPVV